MIAIVVLTHDRLHLLRQCVENVLARTSDLTTEIVIWDNGSSDGTSEYLDRLTDPRVRVVHHGENIGQNAYAEAFRSTTAPYMIELDDDVIDAPLHWDKSLVDAFRELPRIGFLAANIVNNPHDQLARTMYVDRPHLYSEEEMNGVPLIRGPVGGACAITSRELHDRVGGFRTKRKEVFWLEDEAFIADIMTLGFEAAYLRDVRLVHAGGPYYARPSEAKQTFWNNYAKRNARKIFVKRILLRVPFVARLNRRVQWFEPPPDRAGT